MKHQHEPASYWHTFGAHEPALTIAPGDRVTTSTADAFGHDASGEAVSEPSNPLTGPFYVEGAEPGDTLAVRLDSITPNRDSGISLTAITPSLVEPTFVAELPLREQITWSLDREAGYATLQLPGATPPELTVPIAPMLGCIGVAPARGEAISSLRAGAHGGNMDYRHMRAGVTLYLPVLVPGALLFVGDGHAGQGDGEPIPTGIETSMDVEFTVDLERSRRIRWPRGENADAIFALGNARPLTQALQHATTELLRWLLEDFEIDMTAANHLIGQCVEYDLASVHAYSMVAKLPKSVLPARRAAT